MRCLQDSLTVTVIADIPLASKILMGQPRQRNLPGKGEIDTAPTLNYVSKKLTFIRTETPLGRI
jgi:hypothetical protein